MSKNFEFATAEVLMYAVRHEEGGDVDIESTVSKFRSQLTRLVAMRETEEASIALHVDKAFDAEPAGAYRPEQYLTMKVIHSMGITGDAWLTMSKRIKDYLSENASNKRDSGKTFHVKKGSGYARMRDLPPVTLENFLA